MSQNWYQMTAEETAAELNTDPTQGLSEAEAAARLQQYGPNELIERDVRTKKEIIIEQFKGFMTLILIAAALISLALGDWVDAVVILAIVVLNAALGFYQEIQGGAVHGRAETDVGSAGPRPARRRTPRDLGAATSCPATSCCWRRETSSPADGRVVAKRQPADSGGGSHRRIRGSRKAGGRRLRIREAAWPTAAT